ncbi:hypothetical protein KL86DPRO_20357 [uncultured delta proteobacterium]|uniref:Uncharacterized protein n=1 Tax=uncultured delta proteobacterium TaxID=34034 RepID=A0A212JZ95_9DELT|nr:hypothetical protein KL86DPRO_20357 [uncultured delta proteobacterium]
MSAKEFLQQAPGAERAPAAVRHTTPTTHENSWQKHGRSKTYSQTPQGYSESQRQGCPGKTLLSQRPRRQTP